MATILLIDEFLLYIDNYTQIHSVILVYRDEMKIQKEEITIEPGSSFRVFNPSLRNYFYWHYHPELELIYIEGLTGIRHVGQHVSSFMESDLVMIGSNIPHLNFDYGLMTDYQQIVIQLRDNFEKETLLNTPEFTPIQQLFKRAAFGIAFKGETKKQAAILLKDLQGLNNYDRLIKLFEIFNLLALSEEYIQLNEIDTSVKLFLNDKLRMGNIYDHIHKHYHEPTNVNIVADKIGLSTAAFCRYFKKQTNMTFTDFVNQYRINQAKTMLLQDINVSETCYNVGFQSLSYFNKLFKKMTGYGPLQFKKQFLGVN
ncbi:AraC family transcriptional regulator [Pedobacter sp. PLR]|uniref:AraC family transcriptional regulator n=1 Tax=Pedobacter sp. PLR TaxID=2994465 RepID=UPI00224706F0|nr:AraC family transcriptional regulator [Pedobacter sp. PLR]MCX2452410.1 AraC family transcriptional regulator [Pedobacter sp. PLR]